jgi:hypothetical protein
MPGCPGRLPFILHKGAIPMDFQVKSKISGSSGTFTGTINAIIKFVTIAFILLNYAFAAFAYAQNPAGVGIVPLTAVSIFQILLMTFVEPGTRERFPAVNFAVNILMAVGCGVLFFSYKTYLSMAVFFRESGRLVKSQGAHGIWPPLS